MSDIFKHFPVFKICGLIQPQVEHKYLQTWQEKSTNYRKGTGSHFIFCVPDWWPLRWMMFCSVGWHCLIPACTKSPSTYHLRLMYGAGGRGCQSGEEGPGGCMVVVVGGRSQHLLIKRDGLMTVEADGESHLPWRRRRNLRPKAKTGHRLYITPLRGRYRKRWGTHFIWNESCIGFTARFSSLRCDLQSRWPIGWFRIKLQDIVWRDWGCEYKGISGCFTNCEFCMCVLKWGK